MAVKIPVVAIVGRTNVGKSTLFNQIVGRRVAIVEDTPGVTRDRTYAYVNRYAHSFSLIDTGGLLGEEEGDFNQLVRLQAEVAIEEADLIIVLFDGLVGPHPQDREIVDILRRSSKPVLWVVNKCEKPATEFSATDFYSLGIEKIECLSAEHNVGVGDLVDQLLDLPVFGRADKAAVDQLEERETIRVAIVGKPNSGKSTLVNKLLGEDRLVTSDVPGTTRDSIETRLKREGQLYTIVDTAGLRKKRKIKGGSIERYSNLRALKSLASCDVAVLLLDASAGVPTEQDAKIAGLIHERGRGMVIVVNKWDAVEKNHRSAKEYQSRLFEVFKFTRYAPVLFVSALTGKRCPSILPKVKEVYDNGRIRIQTSDLNRVLSAAMVKHPPPQQNGAPLKLYFAVQAEVAPPTFILFVNHPKKVHFSYQRYLKNRLRRAFPFPGNDIRLLIRKRTGKEQQLRAGNE